MKYSLAKIAKELGVSKATVSLVLNGKARQARISEDAEKRIKDFCSSVNYVPNIHAQRINSKFVKNIGFLVNQGIRVDDDNPFADYNISSILGGAVMAAGKIDCRISVQLYNREMDENLVFNWLRNNEIDGFIYYGWEMPEEWKEVFAREHRCVVGISVEPDRHIASVNVDNFNASYSLARYMIESGRGNFLYLSGIDGSFVSDERRRGFLAACRESGIAVDEEHIISAEYSEAVAESIVMGYSLDKTDAIVCANDDMAIGAMQALKKRGIEVPGRIAVAGGDNIVTGQYFMPALTTFDIHQHEQGEAAVECMQELLESGVAKQIILPGELIIRESAK